MDNHTSETPLKRCFHCGRELPATPQFFSRRTVSKDGFHPRCKECHGSSFSPPPTPEGYRLCTKCLKLYPETTEYFGCDRNRLRTQCRVCVAHYHSEYGDAHKHLKREYDKQYRAVNAQKIREYKHQWHIANATHVHEYHLRWYRQNADVKRERDADYRKANMDKIIARNHARRVQKRKLPSEPIDEQRALDYFDNCCAVCGRPAGLWHTLAMDHWIAITDKRPNNPGNVATNMIPLCHAKKGAHGQGGCNNNKKNKDPEQWLIERYGKRKANQILKRIRAYFEWVTNS